MTIKEFAKLCGCNSQTLRYYDRIDLLKPVEVDQWSGYRFYDETQAIEFVKIKNLQAAGCTIEEIKKLMGKNDAEIYKALEERNDGATASGNISISYLQHIADHKENITGSVFLMFHIILPVLQAC